METARKNELAPKNGACSKIFQISSQQSYLKIEYQRLRQNKHSFNTKVHSPYVPKYKRNYNLQLFI